MKPNPSFWTFLEGSNLIGKSEIDTVRREVADDAYEGLQFLIRNQPLEKHRFCKIWGDSIGFASVDLEASLFAQSLIERIPREVASRLLVIPLYEFAGTVTVACAEPMNREGLLELSDVLREPVSPVYAWPDDIRASIEVHYQSEQEIQDMIRRLLNKPFFRNMQDISLEQLRIGAGDQALVEFTQALLLLAAKERASDIHIEPSEVRGRVRFRIDGVLREMLTISRTVHQMLVSRLKIMAQLDIMERRRPQDGRLTLEIPGRSLDFRFSSVPSIYGEKVVLRFLGRINKVSIPSLDDLALSRRERKSIDRVLAHPQGAFLLTGPTGSGKTTTLYAMLKKLNQDDVNIMTIEDPVEYRMGGVTQIQVNPAADLTFANALRSFLRQDPDVILVGEIRDQETANIALQAALTGHLVLSTMHTNSAIQAITRLLDFGIEPFLVGPALIGAMGQRLVRRICEKCKEQYHPSEELMDEFFIRNGSSSVTFFRGKGCPDCRGTGFRGRTSIHETFLPDDHIRDMIAQKATSIDLETAARKQGYTGLWWDGMKKVLRGITTIEEVDRVSAER